MPGPGLAPPQPHPRPVAPADHTSETILIRQLTGSEQQWLRIRNHLRDHRHELAICAAREYPESATVEGTPLLSTPLWLPHEPIPLDRIKLQYTHAEEFDGITGVEPIIQRLLPIRADRARYRSYSDAVAALAAPAVFENRSTYRLLRADLQSNP
jgi:hypothetical protein